MTYAPGPSDAPSSRSGAGQPSEYWLVNADILDVRSGDVHEARSICIADGQIREIAAGTGSSVLPSVDLERRIVMPGLIDAHVHVMASDLNLADLPRRSSTLLAAESVTILRDMLLRGFTTVRDAGGADWGLAEAIRRGLIDGPRLFISGRGIAQTGGQGDFRRVEDTELPDYCAHALGPMTRVADGSDAIRYAVREELRRGADQIKIFAGGGIAGGVPLEFSHFSIDEIRVACEEAAAVGTYVMAHAYAASSILRAVDAGARTIEHGNLITEEVASQISGRAFIVPTLAALDGRIRHANEIGIGAEVVHRMIEVLGRGLEAIETCRRAGVPVGFGTDLEGIIQPHQLDEFKIRSAVQTPLELIQSATIVNAEILRKQDRLGVVQEGAQADLLILGSNPADNIGILQDPAHIHGIIQNGRIVTRAF